MKKSHIGWAIQTIFLSKTWKAHQLDSEVLLNFNKFLKNKDKFKFMVA